MGLIRERLVLPLLLVAAAVVFVLVTVRREEAVARQRVAYEDEALAAARAVAHAQKRHHEDRGRYGWIADLERADLLRGLHVVDRDGARAVACTRYRIDVLLPYALGPGEVVMIATQDEKRENVDLERRHFAVVARPAGDELTGFRTYYLDEKDEVYVSEGVSNVAARSRRPLPPVMITLNRGLPGQVAGLRWWHLDALPPR